MRHLRMLAAALGIVVGVAAVLLGGADDSPGLQGIGVLVVGVTLWRVVRGLRPESR